MLIPLESREDINMPIHTIKFSLPEEASELQIAMDGPKMYSILCDFREWLRVRWKHGTPDTKTAAQEYEAIREEFWRLLNDNQIDLSL